MLRSLTLALFVTLAAPAVAQNSEAPSAPQLPGVQAPVAPGIGGPEQRRAPRRAAARNLTPEQRVARISQRCAQTSTGQRGARFCQRWQGMNDAQRAEFIDRAMQRAAQRRARQPA